MGFAVICDICKLPLNRRATSVQILPGYLHATTGGVDIRTVHGAEAFSLCNPCADRVTDLLHHLVNGENIAEVHPDGGSCPIRDPGAHLAVD